MSSTIKDIAEAVGVNTGTVSRALNNKPGVGPGLRKKIVAMAEKMEYRPDAHARGLVTRRTEAIGLLCESGAGALWTNPFYGEVIAGVEAVTRTQGFSLMIGACEGEISRDAETLPKFIREHLVDGVLVVGWVPRHVLDPLRRVGYPFVLVDYRFADEHADAVVTDNRKGMRMATEHLIKLGHQRIAFVGGPLNEGNFRERFEGYREALEAAGLAPDDHLVGDLPLNSDREATVLRVGDRALGASAIVCSNDLVALDAIRILSEHGRRIPSDISVVGFDDIQAASYSHPPLTTMRVDKQAMGRRAAQRLLERLREPRSLSVEESVFQPELVVRQSTGPGPKA